MPDIAPCLDYPAGGTVKAAVGDDRQAGVYCEGAAWLIKRQMCHIFDFFY
jgi:hypothetical protein